MAAMLLLSLGLLTLESVVVKYTGFSVARVDVTVAVLCFLALRAATLEGAITSFCVGYLLDLMSGRPTGLFTFLAVLTFLVGRLAASVVDVRSSTSFALFVMAADAGHVLLGTVFTWMVSPDDARTFGPLYALPAQVILTGIAAVLLHPIFKRLDPGDSQRVKPSLLR
ncbi:MAG: hypothetical protein ACJ790_09315 [Myxococcaceae bacterium]